MKIGYLTRILLMLVALAAGSAFDAAHRPARAVGVLVCSFSVTNVMFGSVDVLPGAAFSANATLAINCNGAAILPTTVFVCVTFPTPRVMTGPSSATLQYDILGPPPATTSWSNTTPIAIPTAGNIVSFTASTSLTISASLLANQQSAPPGTYTQTVNATISFSTTSCTSGLIVGSNSASFQVSATVVKSCNVSANNLYFGTTGNLITAISGQTQISVQCSNGIGYSIGLNGGLSNATDPTQRRMTTGANAIAYGLYQDSAHASPWGSTTGTNVVGGTGTSLSQAIPVYGLVPSQTTPPPGTYSDTIVVSVTY
jgi:spore coat protein U-like protein